VNIASEKGTIAAQGRSLRISRTRVIWNQRTSIEKEGGRVKGKRGLAGGTKTRKQRVAGKGKEEAQT